MYTCSGAEDDVVKRFQIPLFSAITFSAMRALCLVIVAFISALPRDIIAALGPPNESPGAVSAHDTDHEERGADPLISKFPKLVEWFRSHGGTSE
jgi:hypothetical protein